VQLRRNEDGIALIMALGVMFVLAVLTTSMVAYTRANTQSASLQGSNRQASQYAESALNYAYSLIVAQKTTANGNPTAANLLGCAGATGATDTTPPSNCATPVPKLICFAAATCTAGSLDSASVYGYFSGANPGTFAGTTVPASTWLLVAAGYARNPNTGGIDVKGTRATIKINPLDSGAVASVWNHMFITSPLVAGQCGVDFGGNGVVITDPLYVIGNLCLSGQNVAVQEAVGGQPVDLQVGGRLLLSGSGTKVGTDSTHGITSGVVVGGCSTVSLLSVTACNSGSYNYWVKTADSFVQNDEPERSAADITKDYGAFDPGPQHACAVGGLPSSTFDGDGVQNGTNATFELTPSASYTCVSQLGAAVGQLSWNNSTKVLTVAGSIFLDGSLTISQSGTYTGTAVLEVNGKVTVNGNGTALCATGPPCDFDHWQGSSGNTSMLTFVALAASTTAISFTNNAETFQGSLWCQPSSAMTFLKNGVTVEGPISVGKFDNSFNNATFKPLPVIKNMPVGAPVPPNTGVTIGPLVTVG
jgi:Tfp pilus assembly protein PilX